MTIRVAGSRSPGMTAGTCLRKDFAFSEERSNAPGMLLAVSRVNESVPLFLIEGVKRRLVLARQPQGRGARSDVQARHRRRARLALAEADPAARARAGGRRGLRSPRGLTPTQPLGETLEDAEVVDHRDQPLGVHRAGRCSSEILRLARAPSCLVVDPWNALGSAQVFAYATESAELLGARPRGGRRHVSRVLVTGGAGTIGRAVVRRLLRDADWEVRVSDHREAPLWMREGCEVHMGDLRDEDVSRAAIAGCSHVIHLAAIVGGIANFHKLPFTLTQVNNALTGSVVGAAVSEDVERLVYVSSSMVFERATEFPTTEEHIHTCPAPWSAYGFSKLSGEVYARAAHDQHGLRVHGLPPVQRLRPRRAAGPRRARDRARGAGPDREGARRTAPAADLRLRRADADADACRRHRRRDRHGDGLARRRGRGLQHLASEELTVAQIAALIWEVCGRDPADFELEHLPSFEVDVQRRWPSVEKAKRVLGWEAKVDLRDGLLATAEWLRTTLPDAG